MLIFSLKWTVILGLVALLFAYHLGNGDVRQGAQAAAQNSEGITQQIGNTLRQCESRLIEDHICSLQAIGGAHSSCLLQFIGNTRLILKAFVSIFPPLSKYRLYCAEQLH